ncbi:MAG TPA: zinc ABC transporter substrate-binding protein [Candidatus Deferrimicrobium sp.]|nr:zinc ABC transporter substrate-binding protein [Candidatus Deferrimicrobium sp.]
MKKIWILFLIALIPLLLVCNCGPTGKHAVDKIKSVTVSVLPQQYFVQRIVGDDYKINVMISPGQSEATYEPTPREMKAVSDSAIYFRIGHLAFEEAWLDKIASLNKQLKIVDTSEGVSLITGTDSHSSHMAHGEAKIPQATGDHDHSGIDPHIWLSPTEVKVQAKHMLDAFMEIEKDAARRAIYEKNYGEFMKDINELHAETEALLKPVAGKKFMVYHPAFAYFARDYGLIQVSIESEGKSPSAITMKQIVDTARKENIRVIFVQQQFDTANAWAVANEIGGKVITVDPLAPDWLDNMRKIARTFKEALELK